MITSPTYKQLEARLRIGVFTLRQWSEILLSATFALLFALYVSPFGIATTIFVSIVAAGIPIAVSYGAMSQEWSVLDALHAQWGWLTRPRRRLPGPGADTQGYLVLAASKATEELDHALSEDLVETKDMDMEEGALWDF